MTAPAYVARSTPAGYANPDGWKVLLTFSLKPALAIYEEKITPGKISGGDPIPMTTQHNSKVHTQLPPTLRKHGEMKVSAGYDPDSYADLISMVNVNQTISKLYPNGGKWAAFGWLQDVEQGEEEQGKRPMMTLTIQLSNIDPASGAEQEPTYAGAAGT